MNEQGLLALILAAGKATRFKSEHSKMLHRLAGQPLGEYMLQTAQALKPERVCMVIGHESAEVRKAFEGPGIDFVEQKEQLGTGHALMTARSEIESSKCAYVLALVGDAPLLRAETLRDLMSVHTLSAAAATVLTTRLENPYGYGRVVRLGAAKSGRVRAIVEEKVATPAERRIKEISSGILCFSRQPLLLHLNKLTNQNAQKEFLLTDLIHIFNAHKEKVMAFPVEDGREVLGVNDRVELAQMERLLRRRKAEALARDGVTIVDLDATYIDARVLVGRDTVIAPGVSLLGNTRVGGACTLEPHSVITDSVLGDRVTVRPNCVITACEIGSDVTLGPFAHLREGAIVEQYARIGNYVEVKKSRVGTGSKALHLTYLGDATLGAKVNVGAGTVTCNYDGEKKSPTTIEEGSFIGSGTMLVAPVKIGKGSYVAAGSTITENVPPGSLGIGRALQVNKEGWVNQRKQAKTPVSPDTRMAGEIAIIDVTGRVTLGDTAKAMGGRIQEAIKSGCTQVLVNLSRVTYIDSSGLGELMSGYSKLSRGGGILKLTGVSKELSYLFHVANLDRILEIFPDEAMALESFKVSSTKVDIT